MVCSLNVLFFMKFIGLLKVSWIIGFNVIFVVLLVGESDINIGGIML